MFFKKHTALFVYVDGLIINKHNEDSDFHKTS